VLADFAKLDVKNKRIVLHDGVGRSFWLNPNRHDAKEGAARIDWSFTVWQPASWERLRQLPPDLNPTVPQDIASGPPAQIEVYTDGNIHWEDVTVPNDLEIVDERLEAHGFTFLDGNVLEGTVTDLATKQPIAARVQLQRIEPQAKGGYRYTSVGDTTADKKGHWVLKNAPAGWHRVSIVADGYVPRIAGHAQFDNQPGWHSYDCALARPATVAGRVTDDAGEPLADVDVRLDNVATETGGRYESTLEYKTKSDADGRFHFEQVPVGSATIWLHKPGYCRPGLGPSITTPKDDIALSMIQSAKLRVTVDFAATTRPDTYIVQIEPEGGSTIGSWGGSGHIDADNQIAFAEIPPGRYVLTGRPNPGSEQQQTNPVAVELKGGKLAEVTLTAK
jgi:hypothetical protein